MSVKARLALENQTDTLEAEAPPLALQGAALRAARGAMKQREVVTGITDPDTGKELSVGRYQHWERGMNAPKRVLWEALSARLKIDVAGLYTQGETGEAVKVAALRPVLAALRRNLDLLDTLTAPAPTNEHLEKLGYKRPGKGKGKKR